MSDDGYWFFIGLDPVEHASLVAPFRKASAVASAEHNSQFEAWSKRPADTYDVAPGLSELEPFPQLAGALLFDDQPFSMNEAGKEPVAWLSMNRDTPARAIFHAIGPKLAKRLPGMFGNMLLDSEEVPRLLRLLGEVRRKLAEVDAAEELELTATLVSGVRNAVDAKSGLVAFALWNSTLGEMHFARDKEGQARAKHLRSTSSIVISLQLPGAGNDKAMRLESRLIELLVPKVGELSGAGGGRVWIAPYHPGVAGKQDQPDPQAMAEVENTIRQLIAPDLEAAGATVDMTWHP